MTQQKKKSTKPLPSKKHKPTIHPMELIQKTQEKMSAFGDENLDNIHAVFESGNISSDAFKNISSEITENCNRMLSDSVELSQSALVCRTFGDMIKLQSRAIRQISDNYSAMTHKLYEALISSYLEAWAPIKERSDIVSDRLRKTLAA